MFIEFVDCFEEFISRLFGCFCGVKFFVDIVFDDSEFVYDFEEVYFVFVIS